MAFDIFAPSVSKVAEGIEGKSILIYGGNKCGKTYVCAHMPKPFFFAFELGLDALTDIPYVYPDRWGTFLSALNQFAKNPDKAKERYQTLVIDQLEAMGASCTEYVCSNAGINNFNEKPMLSNGKVDGWFNPWNVLDSELDEVFRKIRFLLDKGFTFCFIAHEGTRLNDDQTEKIYPRGNKRVIDRVVDLCSYIGYVKSNGIADDGQIVKSSLYLHDTPTRLGGGRFTTLVPGLKEFTAENLINAITNAAKDEAKITGSNTVTNEEFVEGRTKTELISYEEAKEKSINLCKQIAKVNPELAYKAKGVIESHLGKDKTISDNTSPKEVELLNVIYEDLVLLVKNEPTLSEIVL